MKIENIAIKNDGYVKCESCFYMSKDVLDGDEYHFSSGVNLLRGEIDSDNWAISYLMSMYDPKNEEIILFEPAELSVNGETMKLSDFMKYSCYMDKSYPLFSSKTPIKKLVSDSIKKNKKEYSADYIRELFNISDFRFERSLSGVGHEIFRAMAAIGYVNNKQVFCFPWMSMRRFKAYNNHMSDLLNILDLLGAVVILPLGNNAK